MKAGKTKKKYFIALKFNQSRFFIAHENVRKHSQVFQRINVEYLIL